MAEDKRYYWIKLKGEFFDLETIDWLISQKNGCEYIVLYQKLCLMTANKDGNLSMQVGEMIIPYDCQKIARDTKFSVNTVSTAMELFKKIGLLCEQDNGIFKIPYVSELVGSETSSARKKRTQRDKKKQLQEGQEGDNVPDNVPDNVRQEIRDKILENRYKSIDIDTDIDAEAVDYCDPGAKLQSFMNHLQLTDNQIEDLIDKIGLESFDEYTKRLNSYIERTGATVKNHYTTILKWYNEDRAVSECI